MRFLPTLCALVGLVPVLALAAPIAIAAGPQTRATAEVPRAPAIVRSEDDGEGEPQSVADLLQPAPASPDRQTSPGTTQRRAATSRRPAARLASVPNMFGDFGGGGPVLHTDFQTTNPLGGIRSSAFETTLPPSGGVRRSKIGEQNKALPEDRVYFFYNHFEHANSNVLATGQRQLLPIDRYTFGFEKTFFDAQSSIEVRMPFSNSFSAIGNPADPAEFNASGGQFGNVVLIPKLLLYQTENTAISTGFGLELPTGSDVTGQANTGTFRFANDAVWLSPYAAIMQRPADQFYWLAFAQFALATNGNRMSIVNPVLGNANLGRYNDQNLAFLDLAAGYIFYTNPDAARLTQLAAQAEVHYAGTVQNADQLANVRGTTSMVLAPQCASTNIVNLTFALNATLGQTLVRVGASAPVTDQPNRFFDSELQAAVIRRF